jgi:hypothetical protein
MFSGIAASEWASFSRHETKRNERGRRVAISHSASVVSDSGLTFGMLPSRHGRRYQDQSHVGYTVDDVVSTRFSYCSRCPIKRRSRV